MPPKNKKLSRLTTALLETAKDMHDTKIMSQSSYDKITMRHLGDKEETSIKLLIDEITGEEIQRMRRRAQMSQAVFARYLNLTPGYISKLERGEVRPTGSTVVLLNLIKRKGIDAIF